MGGEASRWKPLGRGGGERSRLQYDRAPLKEPDKSPLCGSEMKCSSPAFIAQVTIHPFNGTIRRERERACVLFCVVIITYIW